MPSIPATVSLMLIVALPCLSQEPVTIELDRAEGLTISAPAGFNQANHSFGAVPEGEGTNGQGLTVSLGNGDGFILYGPSVETGPGDVLIECSVWTNTPNLYLALVGLNAPVDGSLIANMPANGAEYVGSWHTMKVIYDPKDDSIMPAFQVASLADGLGVVYVDQIVVTPVTVEPRASINVETITIDLAGLPSGAKPLEMVLIQPGTFVMGSPPTEQDRGDDEGPQHDVTISQAFYLGRYEVTQAQWEAVMGGTPSYFSGNPDRPVDSVSWDDCQAYIESLNGLDQGTFRLPTEAEWEYACRAGTTTRFYWGDDPSNSEIIDYAWYTEYSGHRTHDVGQKLPNPWGLNDMSGNVHEWCEDTYGSYTSSAQTDPEGPPPGNTPVVRGGHWYDSPGECRSAYRNWYGADHENPAFGFRVVVSSRTN